MGDCVGAAKVAVLLRDQMFTALEYLIKLGHHRICFLEAVVNSAVLDEVSDSLGKWTSRGCKIEVIYKENFYDAEKTCEQLDCVLAMPSESRPSAIICYDDKVAAWTINHMQSLGLSVPGDMSVLGIDNFDIGLCTKPKISTLALSYEEIGEKAIDLFIGQLQLAGKQTTDPIREVNYRIIERESCGSVSGS